MSRAHSSMWLSVVLHSGLSSTCSVSQDFGEKAMLSLFSREQKRKSMPTSEQLQPLEQARKAWENFLLNPELAFPGSGLAGCCHAWAGDNGLHS